MKIKKIITITKLLTKFVKFYQKKYTKIFKKLPKTFFFIEKLNFKKKIDKRIFLGSLKYIPYLLFCFLKTLPMPWEKNKKANILFHTSKTLIVAISSYTFEILYLSQWSTLWLLTKKESVFKKNRKKINFPLFDGEESFKHIVEISKELQNAQVLLYKYVLSYYTIKNWFYICKKLSFFFLKNQNKKVFCFDFIIEIILIKLIIRGGIFKKKTQNLANLNFKKNFFDYKTNFKINSSCPFYQSIVKKFDNQKYKLNYPALYHLHSFSETSKLKGFIKNSCLINFEYIKNSKNSNYLESDKIYGELKFINFIVHNRKNIIKNKVFFPFFVDLFFSKRKLSFITKFYEYYLEIILQKHYMKPIYKVALIKKLIFFNNNITNFKIISSQYCLLRTYVYGIWKKKKKITKNFCLINIFSENSFFFKGEAFWIDIGIYVGSQSHKMMTLLLGRKQLKFLHLDFNFNLQPIRILTTKERKKSRFSNSFHFCREILRFIKIVIDIHVYFKIGILDEYQLIDSMSYIFTHVGYLTGIYRYKYKTLKQIRLCKSISQIIMNKYNKKRIKRHSGFGFWAPTWRVWLFFLRGSVPILQRWLSNLLSRHFFGRAKNKKEKNLTKQKISTYFDIQLKNSLYEEMKKKILPQFFLDSFSKTIYTDMNQAWKLWKANLSWNKKNMNFAYRSLIFKYLKIKSDWYIKTTFLERDKIKKKNKINKNLVKKNLGRLTRLWFKAEQNRQKNYIEMGPYISSLELSYSLSIFAEWLETINFNIIDFPIFSKKNNLKLLVLGIQNIRETNFNHKLKFEKSKKLDDMLNNPYEVLKIIKEKILLDRSFTEIGISFLDNFWNLIPIYFVEIEEQITDSYIDQYLWLEGTKKFLFPTWIKPSDSEIAPFLVYKISSYLCKNWVNYYKKSRKKTYLINAQYLHTWENIDLLFLKKLLIGILDKNISNYIISKNNINLFYKDMIYTNWIGIIRGLKFSGFTLQVYLLLSDLFLLGLKNAKILYINKGLNKLNTYESKKNHFIIFYLRYFSKIFLLIKTKNVNLVYNFNSNYLLKNLKNKIPLEINQIIFQNIYKNINLHKLEKITISLCGYVINIKLIDNSKKNGIWFFKENSKIQKFIYAFTRISNFSIKHFEYKIRQILFISSSTTFIKISNRWNLNILGTISYFRESCKNNKKFLQLLSIIEEKIQNKVKIGLNSKMPSRFPPVLFYAPKELGGLGMFSVSDPFVPDTDLKYSSESILDKYKREHTVLCNIQIIPSLINYILDWKYEFIQSHKVWTEFLSRKFYSKMNKQQISLEDLNDLWDKGIPRINTLFFKDRHTLVFNYGWRIRSEMKKYNSLKINPFWWTSFRQDGKLWNLNKYRVDLIECLGGIENILEHSLFKGTYFSTWEGLFWEKSSGFEQSFHSKNLTNAQKFGMNQIPNRRFILWWSPTINRANIYIGFRVQLDLTGIFMHGKIPSLKISLIQIFRSHLWQKIHESLVIDISKKLDKNMKYLHIQIVQKEQIHPRKSYKLNTSCADIILYSNTKWLMGLPSLLVDNTYSSKNIATCISDKFWLDLQLRWGDFDSHDVERYSRSKFLDYTTHLKGIYPCITGAIISIDLAYNIFSGYGFWYKNIRIFLQGLILKLMKTNLSLFTLRERIRKSLQLYLEDSKKFYLDLINYSAIFENGNTWFFDDSCFYRVSVHHSLEGNLIVKPANGALIVFSPKQGKLFFRIIHRSFWQNQKRLTQIAKWKAAEEIIKLINYLPKIDQPNEIIVLKNDNIETLITHLIDFPEITVKGSIFKISFQSLIKIRKIGKMLNLAKNNSLFIYNLYDNWLSSISSFTAFSRLLLILKSIFINVEKTERILNQFDYKRDNIFFWPNILDENWVKIEIILKDMIVEEYCYRNKINPNYLSNDHIRLIILGIQDIQIDRILPKNKQIIKSMFENRILKTSDFLGKNLLVKILTQNNNKSFIFLSNWKINSIFIENQSLFLRNLKVELCLSNSIHSIYIVPRNIVKQFIMISEPCFRIIGLMFGFSNHQSSTNIEIRVILIPPQVFNHEHVIFSKKLVANKILLRYKFVGYMKTTKKQIISFIKNFLPNLCEFIQSVNNEKTFILIMINLEKYNCKLFGIRVKYFVRNDKSFIQEKIQLYLSERFLGFFLVPINKKWNYFFNLIAYESIKKFDYTIDIPNSLFGFIDLI